MMSDKAALGSVQQSLRRCFDAIEQHQEDWKLALRECEPLLSTLSNLAEQLQACQKVIFRNTPLSFFPDLQERLRFKLEAALEVTLEKLNEKMYTLQKVKDAVSHHVGSVMYLYEVNAEKISLEVSLERHPLSPSLADMLEWLQNIEKHYRNQFLRRKLLLQVRYDRLSEIQTLPQSWSNIGSKSASLHQLVEGASHRRSSCLFLFFRGWGVFPGPEAEDTRASLDFAGWNLSDALLNVSFFREAV